MPYDANYHHVPPIDSWFFDLIFVDAPQGAMVDAVAEKELVARYKFLDGVASNPVGATFTATGSEVPSPSISLPPIFQETVTMTKVDIFYTTLTTEVNAATMTAGVSFFKRPSIDI